MQLTPKEAERLLIFTAAELARRRLAEGVPLSHPDAIALASDVVLEEARVSVHGLLSREQLFPGVAELLAAPAQIEAVFDDGTRLVPLEKLVRR